MSALPTRNTRGLAISELGLGGAQLGNLYRALSDEDATGTVARAWESGIRYFDTAPHYGLGLSERRLGTALAAYPREQMVVSTKVGRRLVPTGGDPAVMDDQGFVVPATSERRWDLSPAGIRAALEESLDRMGLDYVDIALLHDPEEQWESAFGEGMPALLELRREGLVRAIGVGSKYVEPLAELIKRYDLDVVMCAGRYTLLEQDEALLDLAMEREVGVLVAGVYNSGLLARPRPTGEEMYDYHPAAPELLGRVNAIADICEAHGVTLPQAAIGFVLRHPGVTSVVVGAEGPAQVDSALERYRGAIPDELWQALAGAGFISERAARLTPRADPPDRPRMPRHDLPHDSSLEETP